MKEYSGQKHEDIFFLENIVYNEFVTRGFTVFAGKTDKGELDAGNAVRRYAAPDDHGT